MINEEDLKELITYLDDTKEDNDGSIKLDITVGERDTLIDALILYKEMNIH